MGVRFPRPSAVIVGAFIVIVGVLLFFKPVRDWPLYYPIVAFLLFWFISSAVANNWNPLIIAVGTDGMLSASKFQFFAWTGVVVFTYVWFAASRVKTGELSSLDNIPPNLLYAMGFSVITLAGAKGITTGLINSQRISKPQQDSTGNPAELVTNDDGQTPNLTKIQMLIWTLIAIVLYLTRVAHIIHDGDFSKLPDIDAPLMALMGLGQAAYLGNKLTTSNVPILTSLNPSSQKQAALPAAVTINGTQLDGRLIPVCAYATEKYVGNPIDVSPNATSVTFTMPAAIGTRTLLTGDRVDVCVIVDGIQSANSLPFVVL